MASIVECSRRSLLSGLSAAILGLPRPPLVQAQTRTVRIGAIHPVTGPLENIGLGCRLSVQLAVDAVNASGGIAALGGARLELLTADSASASGPRAGAERLIDAGVRALTGAFHSGHTAAVAEVAQRRRVPLLVDTAIADAATSQAAQAAQASGDPLFVFRNFPTTTAFGRRAVQYLTEMFTDAPHPILRAVVLHTTDALATTQARRFEAAHAALRPPFELVELVALPLRATSVAAEVERLRAAAADVLVIAVRASTVGPLFRELGRAPAPFRTTLSLGTPELADVARAAGVGSAVERVMELAPSPNPKNPRTQRLADEFARRSGGRVLDAPAGYAHEAVLIVADALERAASVEAVPLADALRRAWVASPIMVSAGPVVFDGTGDNPNAAPALLQILAGRPVVVWPQSAAERPPSL
jgi:branched-chain amino acid transport system substrate-binding protein